ncbi:MAG: hypothetical protein L6R38_007708 [Xanthoria sp. 2 TBL-2021]|nr:MAG: hypothetical protein L6R38_007708 [Xanthoria sp. 2 TBL-2021]
MFFLREALRAALRCLPTRSNHDSAAVPQHDNEIYTSITSGARAEGTDIHVPLDSPNEIRLLHVHPSRDSDAITCSLVVADFSTKPEYYALSYTWGPPTQEAQQRGMTSRSCCPITCNGATILVTENLFHFLRHAARNFNNKGPWWIDAICINQANVLERNQQILKMADIYATACLVVVWLGEDDVYTAPALRLMNALGSVTMSSRGESIYSAPMGQKLRSASSSGILFNRMTGRLFHDSTAEGGLAGSGSFKSVYCQRQKLTFVAVRMLTLMVWRSLPHTSKLRDGRFRRVLVTAQMGRTLYA